MTPPTTVDHLAEIARAVGYHDGAGWPDDHGDDDCPIDNLIGYKDALEDEVGRLRGGAEAAAKIARRVPQRDTWRSAADFMEDAAATLDYHDVARPDHYPDE